MLGVENPAEALRRPLQEMGIDLPLGGSGLVPRHLADRRPHLLGGLRDFIPFFSVGLGDNLQQLLKRGETVAILRREIGSAVKGDLLRSEKHRQRPSSAAADEELDGVLINLVEIGPLFSIDLIFTKCSFIHCAVSSSSNDSRAITWHQWQAE